MFEIVAINEIYFNEEFERVGVDCTDLIEDIKKNGLVNPILVIRYDKIPGVKFMVLDGYRRILAYKALGKQTIDCIIMNPDK